MQNKPTKFLEYLQSNFNDQENFEKLLDFISTIPNLKPKNKKLTVFIGLPKTGKTTLIYILSEIFPNKINFIEKDAICIENHKSTSYLTNFKNPGVCVFDSINSHDILDSRKLKMLTGNAKIFARELYQKPEEFIPLAQTILISNEMPIFDYNSEALSDRLNIINFTVEHHPNDSKTKKIDELVTHIKTEIPEIISFLKNR